jgi:peptidoglycan/LPS O-acetylase OafA/YrhL
MRRLARVYPLYFVLLGTQLAAGFAIEAAFHGTARWVPVSVADPAFDIPANFLLVQSLGIAPSIITQAWSVSTEVAAYLCFPVLVMLVMTRSWRTAVLAAVFAIALLGVAAVADAYDGAYHSGSLDAYDGTHYAPLMRCLGGFLLGMLTFRAGMTHRLTRVAAYDSIGLLSLVAVMAAFSAGVPDLVIVALFPVMVLCLSRNPGVVARIFANRVIYSLGVWSYAVYLLHPMFQQPRDLMNDTLGAYMPRDVAAISSSSTVVVLLLVLSCVLYKYIEVPGRRAIQRIAPKLTPLQM